MGDRIVWLYAIALAGCAFETTGNSDQSQTVDDAPTSSSGANSTTTQDPIETGGGSNGALDSSTSGETSTTSSNADGNASTNATTGVAVLEFDGNDPLDLGTLPLEGSDATLLTLRNTGNAAADVLGGEIASPLSWAGGTEFPGAGGDCQGLLPPGATCTIAIALAGGQPGFSARRVDVDYDDGEQDQQARLQMEFLAEGIGPNLLINPDGELDGPGPTITGWSQVDGDFRMDGGCSHGNGNVCFYAGAASSSALVQDIDVSAWAEQFEAAPLGLSFEGWSFSNYTFDDPHDISVRCYDAMDNIVASRERTEMDHRDWEATRFDILLPPQTRRIRVSVVCDRDWGNNCSAWFDDFRANFVYPLPE